MDRPLAAAHGNVNFFIIRALLLSLRMDNQVGHLQIQSFRFSLPTVFQATTEDVYNATASIFGLYLPTDLKHL